MSLKNQNSQPHNDGSVNPANSEVQVAASGPLPDEASAAEADPFPPPTGSALEAADRALLKAEDARLQRLGEAMYREYLRHGDEGAKAAAHNFPWVHRVLTNNRLPPRDWRHRELYRQVQDELKRKQLERKQGQDKEG